MNNPLLLNSKKKRGHLEEAVTGAVALVMSWYLRALSLLMFVLERPCVKTCVSLLKNIANRSNCLSSQKCMYFRANEGTQFVFPLQDSFHSLIPLTGMDTSNSGSRRGSPFARGYLQHARFLRSYHLRSSLPTQRYL